MKKIVIKGAREHNLKNIDVEIPRDKLVVITGLSGSGKSSLAFDTIYAEGQRRYVESLSAYARQFLDQMHKPDVDSIEGLSPAISIEQKTGSRNPRSTVGTATEIYDYLRLLWARVGTVHCYNCGAADRVADHPADGRSGAGAARGRALLGAGAGRARAEGRRSPTVLAKLRQDGFVRANIDGELAELAEPPELAEGKTHTIEVFVDRLVKKDGIRQRLTDSIELAAKLADGIVKISPLEGDDLLFSEKFACTTCGISYPDITPRLFSFNNPAGACPACDGIGAKMFFDPDLIVPDEELSIKEGAIEPWERRNNVFFHQILDAVCAHFEIDQYVPWGKLPAKARTLLLQGSAGDEVEFSFEKNGRNAHLQARVRGRGREPGAALRGVRAAAARAGAHHRRGLRGDLRRVPPLHVPDGVRGVQRHAAAQGGALRQGRRQEHHRDDRADDPRGLRLPARPEAVAASRRRSPGASCASRATGCRSSTTSASTTCRSTARRRRCRAASRSASGWRRRSAARWSACSTSWTSRRSACTSATTRACCRR